MIGHISIYDIQRAVADKATVPIYYESRISKLALNAVERPKLDAEFEEITEGEELTKKEKLKTKWAALEELVGVPKRIGRRGAADDGQREASLAVDGEPNLVWRLGGQLVEDQSGQEANDPAWHPRGGLGQAVVFGDGMASHGIDTRLSREISPSASGPRSAARGIPRRTRSRVRITAAVRSIGPSMGLLFRGTCKPYELSAHVCK